MQHEIHAHACSKQACACISEVVMCACCLHVCDRRGHSIHILCGGGHLLGHHLQRVGSPGAVCRYSWLQIRVAFHFDFYCLLGMWNTMWESKDWKFCWELGVYYADFPIDYTVLCLSGWPCYKYDRRKIPLIFIKLWLAYCSRYTGFKIKNTALIHFKRQLACTMRDLY